MDAAADQGLVTIIVVGLSVQRGNRLSHQRESFRRPSMLRLRVWVKIRIRVSHSETLR
ncbi:hypothetical protein RESH_01979 [Rhodopirellula europaea SH398]|uniref:Uncharacterized protein n=1 Tax=Rhodopirellula europaea SH398 TaxID=1263868 RepID=M5SIM4_9BACT|nr:hypothetical protein RESH_01979 [Rhodopirellula europaea SH398]